MFVCKTYMINHLDMKFNRLKTLFCPKTIELCSHIPSALVREHRIKLIHKDYDGLGAMVVLDSYNS